MRFFWSGFGFDCLVLRFINAPVKEMSFFYLCTSCRTVVDVLINEDVVAEEGVVSQSVFIVRRGGETQLFFLWSHTSKYQFVTASAFCK